ncbi:MAG: hypothetical protein HRU19_29080 [Pseudobacteriovorax sp.]|nr:hypothetical protein [Pseudobacteriovorax sp.]
MKPHTAKLEWCKVALSIEAMADISKGCTLQLIEKKFGSYGIEVVRELEKFGYIKIEQDLISSIEHDMIDTNIGSTLNRCKVLASSFSMGQSERTNRQKHYYVSDAFSVEASKEIDELRSEFVKRLSDIREKDKDRTDKNSVKIIAILSEDIDV